MRSYSFIMLVSHSLDPAMPPCHDKNCQIQIYKHVLHKLRTSSEDCHA